jgi:hypothetical protein
MTLRVGGGALLATPESNPTRTEESSRGIEPRNSPRWLAMGRSQEPHVSDEALSASSIAAKGRASAHLLFLILSFPQG